MSWECRCGRTIHGMKLEHCAECHETFTNTKAGDMHRVGPHDGDRRCLTPDEMRALPKPLSQDKNGNWRLPAGKRPEHWARRAVPDGASVVSSAEQGSGVGESHPCDSSPQIGSDGWNRNPVAVVSPWLGDDPAADLTTLADLKDEV